MLGKQVAHLKLSAEEIGRGDAAPIAVMRGGNIAAGWARGLKFEAGVEFTVTRLGLSDRTIFEISIPKPQQDKK